MAAEEIIDTHTHIFPKDFPADPHGLHKPEEDFTAEQLLKVFDDNGVEHAAIVAPSFLGTYNDYFIRALLQHPQLRGTAILEPDVSPYDLRAMDREGMVGVRLSWRGRKELPDLTDVTWQRFFWRLADLGWHAHLHIEGQRIPQVLPQLLKMPMTLVVDHLGRPDPATGAESEGFKALLGGFDSGKMLVKLSGGFRIGCDPKPLVERLMEVGGPEHLAWGSDCPFTDFADKVSYGNVLAAYREWVPKAEDRATIAAVSRKLLKL
jgi:predicted TIM-barrel fold metal-dependent hydrolase